jgi:hypothetical protein
MARMSFTDDELEAMRDALEDLDPTHHELTARYREQLRPQDWAFATDYMRERLRAALEIGIMTRALAALAVDREVADDRGVSHFLRSGAWLHNFGVPTTSDEYFWALSAGADKKLVTALEALIEIAQSRLFNTIEEGLRKLTPLD